MTDGSSVKSFGTDDALFIEENTHFDILPLIILERQMFEAFASFAKNRLREMCGTNTTVVCFVLSH